MRAALGASRWRLMRGTLIEALLTSTLGALFGLAMASAAIASLVALAPSSLPRIAQVRMDGFTWALASGLALLLGMVSGMIPAMLDGSRELHRRISANSRTVARGGHDVMRRSLVMVEIALALVLLAGAGVLVQSVRRLLAVDTGFAADGRLTMLLSVGGPRYDFDAAVHQTWRAVLEGVSAISGVTSAALTSQLPMSSDFDTYGLRMRREEGRDRADAVDGFRFAVSADYAKAMGLRVRRGRFFAPEDRVGAPPVVVINEELAQKFFKGRDSLGEQLQFGPSDSPWRTVVGVVADVRHRGLDAPPAGQLYLPLEQNTFADSYVRLVLQSSLEQSALLPQVRDAVRLVDSSIPIAEVATMEALVAQSATQRRFAERLFQVFSLAALALAAIGIFGVIAGMVCERTREIGVRSALGATSRQILRHFLLEGGRLAAAGIVVGVSISLVVAGALRPLVFGVSVRDPWTLIVCAVGLGVVALAGTAVPTWRATRVDANVALRKGEGATLGSVVVRRSCRTTIAAAGGR